MKMKILFINLTKNTNNFEDMNKLRLLLTNNLVEYFTKNKKIASLTVESDYLEESDIDSIIEKYKDGNYNYIFGFFGLLNLEIFKEKNMLNGNIIVPIYDLRYNTITSFRIVIDLFKIDKYNLLLGESNQLYDAYTIGKDIPIEVFYDTNYNNY